jgi:hypothetical protein
VNIAGSPLCSDRVACPRIVVAVGQEFRHDEQRDALDALRRALDAGQHKMDDVGGQIVFAGGNENLFAADCVAAVVGGHGLCFDQSEIGAAMSLRQVHRARPFAGNQFRQIGSLEIVGAMHGECGDGALGEAGIHRPRHVCGGSEFVHRRSKRVRQALAAMVRIGGKPDPAGLAIGIVGLFESLRRCHAVVLVTGAARLVAALVQRLQNFLAQFRTLAEYGFDHVRSGIGETGQIVVALKTEHFVEHEQDIVNRRLVARHIGLH